MPRAIYISFFAVIFLTISLDAQMRGRGGGSSGERAKIGTLKGKVIDADTKEPLPYTNIVLYRVKDSTAQAGGFTEDDGSFEINEIPAGFYYADIKYVGFEKRRIEKLRFLPKNPETDLGDVELGVGSYMTDDVEVTAERQRFEYKMDKKIINVTDDISAAGGSAVDALERAPSINVDIEGNVSLRGSSNFTVFVNGKPSVLEGTDALQQLPVSSIDHIEIMTNPSAKYDPDGMSGIINVVMMQDASKGVSGQITANAGNYDNYGIDGKLSWGKKKFDITGGINYSTRGFLGSNTQVNEIYGADTNSFRTGDIDGRFGRQRFNLQLGGNYDFTDLFSGNIEFGFGAMDHGRNRTNKIRNWNNFDYDQYSVSKSEDTRERVFWSLNSGFNWILGPGGHKLKLGAFFSYRDGISDDIQEEYLSQPLWTEFDQSISGIRGIEDDHSNDYRFNLEYMLPFDETTQLEAGLVSRIDDEFEDFDQFFLNTVTDDYEFRDLFSNEMNYRRDIHAGYLMFKSDLYTINYQLGLRGEYTYRNVEFQLEEYNNFIERLDLFPTVHLSKEISKGQQLMASYSRRINRPRGYMLEPFPSYNDPYNYRVGNPDLEPEYTDSFEAGYLGYLDKFMLSVEGYYRNTTNQIERLRSVNEDGIFIHTAMNLGQAKSYGIEMNFNYSPSKLLNLSLVPNFFRYEISGNIVTEDASTATETWNVRLFADYRLFENLKFETNAFIAGPTITPQGTRDGFMTVDAGFRFETMGRDLNFIFSARDIFNGRVFENESSGPGFYTLDERQRIGQIVSLTVNYRFNDYKSERRNGDGSGIGDGMDMDDF